MDDNGIIDRGIKICQIFRRKNIIEFKSPDDELSERVLWKVVGYAGIYISKYGVKDSEITITLLRDTKPVKLLKDLAEYVEADHENGIYYIKDWKVDFPIQIVVMSSLKGTENAGLRAISKNPRIEDIEQLLREVSETEDTDLIGWYRDFLDLFSRLDSETIEELKRRDPDMAKTWRDIFGVDQEINTAVNTAVNNTTRTNLYIYVQDGDMRLENAARRANVTPDQFRTDMTNAGYQIPQAQAQTQAQTQAQPV